MSIVANKVAVGITKVQLVPVDNVSRDLALHSKGSIHIGGSDVTTANGYLMDNGDKLIIKLAEGETLWGISTATTSDIYVFVSKID